MKFCALAHVCEESLINPPKKFELISISYELSNSMEPLETYKHYQQFYEEHMKRETTLAHDKFIMQQMAHQQRN